MRAPADSLAVVSVLLAQTLLLQVAKVAHTLRTENFGRLPHSLPAYALAASLASQSPTGRPHDRKTSRQADPKMDPATRAGEICVTKSAQVDLRIPYIGRSTRCVLCLRDIGAARCPCVFSGGGVLSF